MTLRHLLFSLLVVVAFSCQAAGSSWATEAPDLLIPMVHGRSMASAAEARAAAVRAQEKPDNADRMAVVVDFSTVDPSGSGPTEIRVALPQQSILIVKEGTEKRAAGGYTWRGKVFGSDLSSVVLTIDQGVIFGRIDYDGASYSLETVGGSYVVTRKDPSRRGRLANDAVPRPAGRAQAAKAPSSQAATPQAATAVAQAAEDGSRIDVLVLYTSAMQAKYGSSLSAKIQHFVDIANTGYTNSGISLRLNLVGKELYNDGWASENYIIDDALNRITDSAQVATLRDQYKADLVSLLRVYPDPEGGNAACGLSWIMQTVDTSFADSAFSVVEVWDSSENSSYYCDETTFVHELGHNMGCAHDRDHSDGPGAYSYSYGYDRADVPVPFGTIMSYDGPTITYFSSPLLTYQGIPIGIAEGQPDSADNARTINNTRSTVANFRVNLSCATPGRVSVPAADSNGAYMVSWGASATAGVSYTLQEAKNSAFSAGLRTAYSGTALRVSISGRAKGVTYYYRVRASRSGYATSAWRAGAVGCAVPGTLVAKPGSLKVPSVDVDGSYKVSWGASATAGVRYTLQEATNSSFSAGLRTAYSGTGRTASIRGRAKGAKYYYRVAASKSGYRTSAWRVGSGCSVPGTLVATPGGIKVPVADGDGSYTVSWGAPWPRSG